MKKETCYCVYCGAKNSPTNKKCQQCKKCLRPKKHELLDYFYDKIKGDIKGEGISKFFSILESIIRHFWYGTVITLTVVFGIVTAVTPTDEKNSTNEKKVFVPLTNKQKLLGCWRAESLGQTDYYKFINEETVDYYYLDGTEKKRILIPYYIDEKLVEGKLRHFFGLGSIPLDEISGADLIWINEEEWHANYDLDGLYYGTFTKISCQEFDDLTKDVPYNQ